MAIRVTVNGELKAIYFLNKNMFPLFKDLIIPMEKSQTPFFSFGIFSLKKQNTHVKKEIEIEFFSIWEFFFICP